MVTIATRVAEEETQLKVLAAAFLFVLNKTVQVYHHLHPFSTFKDGKSQATFLQQVIIHNKIKTSRNIMEFIGIGECLI